mmetsp:Transcript_3982/g.12414  ORF Transcript_3982/g.12414 Transcript_3982/m.12414 type:complete len:580 (+) Transcript_3982:365-2104(+)
MPVATATMTRIQKLFRRPSSPRKGQSGGGGAWDETKYGGRTTSTTSRTSSSGSIESMGSLDTSFRSRRPSSEPKPADRVTWADAPTWIDPPASYDFTDPAELWWTAAERREQLARTEWLVALETKRKLRDELRPPIPGESRRGLGVACEPSTPAARAAKIASHRRAIVAASRDAAPDGLARFAAHLSVDAVAAAVARLQGDRSLELFDVLLEPSTPPFGLGRRWTRIAAKVEGLRGVKASHGEDVGERILSRLGRLVDYARQPFQITLWADADTAFCDAGELVRRARLLAQLGAYDVRLAEYDLVKVSRTPGARDAHVARLRAVEACGDAAERLAGDAAERDRLAAEVKCWDEPSSRDASSALPRCPSFTTSKVVSDGDGPAADGFPSSSGLQGGVILSKNTKGARNFFKAWVDAWLDAWSPPLQKNVEGKTHTDAFTNFARVHADIDNVGADQPPLWDVVFRRCGASSEEGGAFSVGALPPEFNARFLRSEGFGVAVRGPVLALHDKRAALYASSTKRLKSKKFAESKWQLWRALARVPEVCAALNAEVGLRVVKDVDAWTPGAPVTADISVVGGAAA